MSATGQEDEERPDDIVQDGINLRWAGHRLQGGNIVLNQRYDDAMSKLDGKSDREARATMLRLTKEFKGVNETLASLLSRMSMVNLGVVEMLRRSEDGRAALMMRRAAELLVKGLANAEEEVQALKAALKEAEGQRDNYKSLLAKTNSELKSAQAYAQMSKAVEPASSTLNAGSGKLGTTEDFLVSQHASKQTRGAVGVGKGKAPGRRGKQQQSSDGDATGVAASSLDVQTTTGGGDRNPGGGSGAAGPEPVRGQKGKARAGGATSGSVARISKPRSVGWSQDQQQTRAANATTVGSSKSSSSNSISAEAVSRKHQRETRGAVAGGTAEGAARAGVKRRRVQAEPIEGSKAEDVGNERVDGARSAVSFEGFGEAGEGRRGLGEEAGRGAGLGTSGEKGDGVEETPPAQEEDPAGGWAEPWSGGEIDVGGVDGGDLPSVYDSDDAPSMFF